MKKLTRILFAGVMVFILTISCMADGAQNAEILKELNILYGDPDGNLRLDSELTVGEATAFAVRMYGANNEGEHWSNNYFEAAKSIGLYETDGEYLPEEKISIAEFAKLLVTVLGYDAPARERGGFPAGYMMQAVSLGIFEGMDVKADDTITRGSAISVIARAIDLPIMAVTGYSGQSMEYAVMDGKNGVDFISLRTRLNEMNK